MAVIQTATVSLILESANIYKDLQVFQKVLEQNGFKNFLISYVW